MHKAESLKPTINLKLYINHLTCYKILLILFNVVNNIYYAYNVAKLYLHISFFCLTKIGLLHKFIVRN